MTTQSYYGGDFDSFTRSGHRMHPNATQYERPVPYTHAYYEPPHPDLRSEYPGRPGTRTLIQEQGPENGPAGHTRRRIQVAVFCYSIKLMSGMRADIDTVLPMSPKKDQMQR